MSLIVLLGAIGFYFYLSRPAEPVNDLEIAGNTAFLALGRAGLAVVDISMPEVPRQLAIFDTLGDAKAVAVSDQYAYLADGNQGLRLLDISLPSRPVEIGAYKVVNQALDVTVVGNLVYIAAGRQGLIVVSVPNKSVPAIFLEQGRYAPGPSIQQVTVAGNFAYLLASDRSLRIVRVSRPRQIEEIAVLNLEGEVYAMQVEEDRLYLAAGRRGLLIYDISKPAEATLLQRIPVVGSVKDVFVTGGVFVYLAAGENGLRVLDISALEQITELGNYALPIEANQVFVKEGKVYLADRDVGLYILEAEVQIGLRSIASDEKKRGNAEDVAVDHRFAYLANSGQGLRLIDLTDPQAPEEVAFFDTQGQASGVTLAGDFIYLADGAAGMHVFFLTQGERGQVEVQERTRIESRGSAADAAVVAQTLYLADGAAGLRIFNIEDPSSPRELGSEDTPGIAQAVEVLGDYAYVADGEAGLRVISVLDPVLPAEVGAVDTPGEARSLAVIQRNGNPAQILVFLADGPGGLRVMDVTDPRAPREVASLDLGDYAQDIQLAGDLAYITTHERGLRIISIADLGNLSESGTFDTPGEARGLDLRDGRAYIADFNRGLRILSVENPSQPVEIGFIDVPRNVRKIAVHGSQAFLPDAEQGFRIADVQNPQRPREIGHYDLGGLVDDFAVMNDVVFTAGTAGIQAVNISDPRNPIGLGSLHTIGRPIALSIAKDHAYLAAGDYGLQIVNVSDPVNMRLVSFYETRGNAQDVFTSGNYAYIADGEAGLEIVNIADPQEPKTASVLDQFQDARSVVVSGGYAYLADGPNGIWVIDVEKPVTPQTVAFLETPGTAVDLEIFNFYLFVSTGDQGIQVVYIQDPLHPRLVGSAQLDGLSLDLAITWRPAAGNEPGGLFVFVAKGERGLEVLEESTAVNANRIGLYQTPGMAPAAQVARDRFPLFAGADKEKSVRTMRNYFIDLGLLGLGGYLFWTAAFAQFVLPLRRLGDRFKAAERLWLYTIRAHGPAIRIENGQVRQRAGEEKRRGPGVILLDTASAAMLRTKTAFTRVIGPGVVFTKSGEYLHGETIDLHTQIYPTPPLGPEPHQDPFAPQRKGRNSESDEVYQVWQRKRRETSALTRDGVEAVARILVIVKIHAARGQGGTQFGFDPQSVRLAITREGVVPKELRHMPWYEIPVYLAVEVWREYMGKFTLTDLFELNPDDTANRDGTGESDEGTGLETVIRMVRERLTQAQVDELDAFGRPTRNKVPSQEYQLLKNMGVSVSRVSISGVRFPPAVEAQLVAQWTSSWLDRALREREEVENRRRLAALEGEQDARLLFAETVTRQLGDILTQTQGQASEPNAGDPPDLRASLEMLLKDTQRLAHALTHHYRLTEEEERQLSWLLEWVQRTRT